MDFQHPQMEISQEALTSLQQLEPSPVESPTVLDKQLSDLQPHTRVPMSAMRGLNGSVHGAAYYLAGIQRYSSYAFTVFATLHITNTSIIPLITRSVPASEKILLLTRPYYQSPLMEPLVVILPLFTHIASGIALRIHRRNRSLVRYGASNLSILERLFLRPRVWPPISLTSIAGLILAPLLFGHMFVARILPKQVEGGSSGVGLGFVSHGFAKHPLLSWSWYIALVGVASTHIVWGWAKWMGWTPTGGQLGSIGNKGRSRRWAINGVAAVVATLWMAGGLGVVGRGGKAAGWVAKGWDELYARVPLLGL